MHLEAFRTWPKNESGVGGDGDGGDSLKSAVDAEAGHAVAASWDGVAGLGSTDSKGAGGTADASAAAAGSAASGPSWGAGPGGAAAATDGGAQLQTASMDDKKVHIFSSHFFKKLTEGNEVNAEVNRLRVATAPPPLF